MNESPCPAFLQTVLLRATCEESATSLLSALLRTLCIRGHAVEVTMKTALKVARGSVKMKVVDLVSILLVFATESLSSIAESSTITAPYALTSASTSTTTTGTPTVTVVTITTFLVAQDFNVTALKKRIRKFLMF